MGSKTPNQNKTIRRSSSGLIRCFREFPWPFQSLGTPQHWFEKRKRQQSGASRRLALAGSEAPAATVTVTQRPIPAWADTPRSRPPLSHPSPQGCLPPPFPRGQKAGRNFTVRTFKGENRVQSTWNGAHTTSVAPGLSAQMCAKARLGDLQKDALGGSGGGRGEVTSPRECPLLPGLTGRTSKDRKTTGFLVLGLWLYQRRADSSWPESGAFLRLPRQRDTSRQKLACWGGSWLTPRVAFNPLKVV